MAYSDPAVAKIMKIMAKYVRAKEAGSSLQPPNRGTRKFLRQNTAGNSSVKGTLVTAPIKLTKSVKKGMALATVYAKNTMIKVKIIHRTQACASTKASQ